MKLALASALSLFFAVAAQAAILPRDQSVGHVIGVDTLNCRKCPKTDCTSVRQYKRGDTPGIECSTNVNTSTVNGNVWWDRTLDGCYVTDNYIDYTNGLPPVC